MDRADPACRCAERGTAGNRNRLCGVQRVVSSEDGRAYVDIYGHGLAWPRSRLYMHVFNEVIIPVDTINNHNCINNINFNTPIFSHIIIGMRWK